MAEIVKSEPLEDGITLDFWDNGKIQARNVDGVFVQHASNYSPPAVMSDIKAGRTKRQSRAVMGEVQELLDVLPQEVLDNPIDLWVIKHLATGLVVGGAGVVAIAKELEAYMGRVRGGGHVAKPADGEACSVCGHVNLPGYVLASNEIKSALWALYADLRAVRGELGEDIAGVKVERLGEGDIE